jgi:hypothetical protein
MYKFIPNGSLTKIILPYTKQYKNVSFNNFLEPLTLNFSENEKIGFFVYQKIFQNKTGICFFFFVLFLYPL